MPFCKGFGRVTQMEWGPHQLCIEQDADVAYPDIGIAYVLPQDSSADMTGKD